LVRKKDTPAEARHCRRLFRPPAGCRAAQQRRDPIRMVTIINATAAKPPEGAGDAGPSAGAI
jgi:hypothetical protein